MKHNSLADFTDKKVTSKELFNITIKRITCVTLFGKVTVGIPSCFCSKGSLPPFDKKPKCVRYRMQNRKNPQK